MSGIGGENIKTTKSVLSVAIAFSLLAICLSGVHAEETPVETFPDGQGFGQEVSDAAVALGLGTREDLNDWNPGDDPLGIGKRDDLNNWNPVDDPLGIGKRDDLNDWNPGDGSE